MHLTMFAFGSRGDVQPFVALGRGLKAAGFGVRLATHGVFAHYARDEGFEFADIEGNPQALVQADEGREWMESQGNPLKFVRGFRTLAGPMIREGVRDALAAATGTDAIVMTGPAYYYAHSVAEALGVPFVQAYAQPLHPTREFPSALFPTPFRVPRAFNTLTHVLGGTLFWSLLRPLVNEARREYLGLRPLSPAGSFLSDNRERRPVVYGFSERVIPRPRDWASFVHIAGYWFRDQPGWAPPAALTDFLADGPAPVYIGFGSMSDRNPERLTGIAVDALKRAGRRGILLAGWGGLSQADLPTSILKIESAPHDWLFPRMAAIVHHGGAGTTAAALRAGRPSLVVPFFGDQPFWAARVAQLGVGPAPIPRAALSVERLATGIQAAVGTPAMRDRAAALGAQIEAEDGIGRAVDIIRASLRLERTAPAAEPLAADKARAGRSG